MMHRLSWLVTPLLLVALCALVAWWAVRLLGGASIAVPPPAALDANAGSGRVDAVLASARLFGSRRPGVLSDNVRALGVVADATGRGSVIVSVDGQAAKVYRVGDTLDGRLVSAIRPDEIELEAGGARQVFRLPPARATATGLTIIGNAIGNAAGIAGSGALGSVTGGVVNQPYLPETRVQSPPMPPNGPPEGPPMRRRVPAPAGLVPPPGLNQ